VSRVIGVWNVSLLLTGNNFIVMVILGNTTRRLRMASRQRAVISISLPPGTAKEYKKIAQSRGASLSQMFREMFDLYKQEKLKAEFYRLQKYGVQKAKSLKLTEDEVEKIIFEGR
jgi:hypothetical protein